MQQLNENISELEKHLFNVIDNLDNLTDENFDSNFNNISILVKKIEEKKKNLLDNFGEDVVKSKSDAVHTAIKQIRTKFDSIIEEKKEAQIKISAELANTVNKKKLINYQR